MAYTMGYKIEDLANKSFYFEFKAKSFSQAIYIINKEYEYEFRDFKLYRGTKEYSYYPIAIRIDDKWYTQGLGDLKDK